jgi:hypothetical protein
MLLSFDCEIDNDKKHRLIALVRPLPQDWDENTRSILREGRNYAYFYLPAGGGPLAAVRWRKATSISDGFAHSPQHVSITPIA